MIEILCKQASARRLLIILMRCSSSGESRQKPRSIIHANVPATVKQVYVLDITCAHAYRQEIWTSPVADVKLQALYRHQSMLSIEEFFSLSYMFVSAVSLLHQLRRQSFATVVARDTAWIFCLEDRQQRGSTRYVLNGETIASRCNRQGASVVLQFFVFLLMSLELLIFCVVVYAHRVKIKRRIVVVREKLLCQLTSTLVSIVGILTSVLLVIPLAQYYMFTTSIDSAQRGLFDNILHSPIRVFLSLLINLVTAPLQSILQGQYNIEIDLDKIHANFSCVEPIIDGVTNAYKCPAELSSRGSHHVAEPSPCKESFDCIDDCEVVFPRIVMSSLCVILASLVLCYRLLNLRHNNALTFHGEELALEGQAATATDETRFSTVANRHNKDGCSDVANSTALNALDFSTTKDKVAAGRSMEPAASDCEQRSFVAQLKPDFDGGDCELNGGNAEEDLRQPNGHRASSDNRQYEEVKGLRCQKDRHRTPRLCENGLVKTRNGRTSFRDETVERLEELERYSSSGGEELGDAVLVVEDESEYYIAGFRL